VARCVAAEHKHGVPHAVAFCVPHTAATALIASAASGWGAHGGGAFSGKDPTKVCRKERGEPECGCSFCSQPARLHGPQGHALTPPHTRSHTLMSQVDRSGAYAARQAAKSVVAAGLAARCLVQVSSLTALFGRRAAALQLLSPGP
jgi:hypothetical protein